MNKYFAISTIFLSMMLLVLSGENILAATDGHIGLLTVSEGFNNTERGGIADLYLEVKPGSGRIFIDSFPLSKLDTQITMRFASEVACELLDKDCSNYDFFYTITANSAVVGGPSAGAAATVLTVIVLDEQKIDNKTIMTGTINSGNLIGPVAGVPAKTLAAQMHGYEKVLIPSWDNTNNTPYENLTIDVIPISTLEDALYHFTGKNYSTDLSLEDSGYVEDYDELMMEITTQLCTKYGRVEDGNIILPNLTNYGVNMTNSSDNFMQALDAINSGSYYSAASFCFGGNVKITSELLEEYSDNELKIEYARLLSNITQAQHDLESKKDDINTISELETYMIVAERLSDSTEILSRMNPNNISAQQLAFATERFNTALIWSKFYGLRGQEFNMDEQFLKNACSKKLAEAEERVNYLELYYPDGEVRTGLRKAYDYYSQEDYALCIFTSSQVKADSNVVLSAIFVSSNDTSRLLEEKLNAAQNVMARQAQKDVFPILGYSYYEYSNSLKDSDIYSALLYSEYSLELSNIDMYFEKKELLDLNEAANYDYYIFFAGLICGILVAGLIFTVTKNNSKARKKQRRRAN